MQDKPENWKKVRSDSFVPSLYILQVSARSKSLKATANKVHYKSL